MIARESNNIKHGIVQFMLLLLMHVHMYCTCRIQEYYMMYSACVDCIWQHNYASNS